MCDVWMLILRIGCGVIMSSVRGTNICAVSAVLGQNVYIYLYVVYIYINM